MVDVCAMCRDCENECPTQAFDADSGESDPVLCISCMRCVTVCPDEVIEVDKERSWSFEDFKKAFNLTEEIMEAKKSRIITES
jgi:Fe-S-cluster-containing hydrogenase component 2